jgi:hypothetical protein
MTSQSRTWKAIVLLGSAGILALVGCGGQKTTGPAVGREGAGGTAGRGGEGGASGGAVGSGGAPGKGSGGSTGTGTAGAGGSSAGGSAGPDAAVLDAPAPNEDTAVADASAPTDTRPMLPTAAVPQPWQSQDIGTVGMPGGSGRSRRNFQVRGSGGDVWAEADSFHFLQRQVTGDAEIVARLASLERTSADAKAGVMFRENMMPDARNVFMLAFPSTTNAAGVVMPGKGSRMQFRDKRVDNLTAFTDLLSVVPGTPDAPPVWLKLSRRGSLFEGFVSADGTTWLKDGQISIANLAPAMAVGLAVTSHTNGNAALAVFESLRITALTDATWSHDELGTVGGYAAGAPRRFELSNAGRGIVNDEDGITFVHRNAPALGDVEVTAQIAAMEYGSKAARVGVALRGMLRGDARMVSFVVEIGPNGQRYRLQRRAQDGGDVSTTEDQTPKPDGGVADAAPAGDAGADGGAPVVAFQPVWLKLVRVGHRFVGFVSNDGRRYRPVIDLPSFVVASNAFAGVTLASMTEGETVDSRVENVTVVSPPTTELPPLPVKPDAGADAE